MNLKLAAVPILTASLTNVLPKYTAPVIPVWPGVDHADIDGEIIVEHFEMMGLYLKNLSANALNQFQIHGRFAPGGALVALATVAGDYSTPNWPVQRAVGAPVTLAAAGTAHVFVNITELYSIVFKAQVATADGTIDLEATFK